MYQGLSCGAGPAAGAKGGRYRSLEGKTSAAKGIKQPRAPVLQIFQKKCGKAKQKRLFAPL
jgi:hypothetical protein